MRSRRQRLAVDELECECVTVRHFDELEHAADMRMTEARREPRFAHEALDRRRLVEVLRAQKLQCHGAIRVDVLRAIDDTHRTTTEVRLDEIGAKHRADELQRQQRRDASTCGGCRRRRRAACVSHRSAYRGPSAVVLGESPAKQYNVVVFCCWHAGSRR